MFILVGPSTSATTALVTLKIEGFGNHSREMACKPSVKQDSLSDAISFCNTFPCKGIHDKNCDGTSTVSYTHLTLPTKA